MDNNWNRHFVTEFEGGMHKYYRAFKALLSRHITVNPSVSGSLRFGLRKYVLKSISLQSQDPKAKGSERYLYASLSNAALFT